MKSSHPRILFFAAAIGAAMLPGAVFGQTTTATTTPVGFVTLTVPAAVDASTPSSAALALPLYNPAAFQGLVASVDSTNTFTLAGATFTAGQFAVQATPYFVRMMSGNSVGRFFLISANTTSQLTVYNNGADLTTIISSSDSAQIVPANTLSSLFGATAPGFVTGASASVSDNVFLWNGTTFDAYYNNGTNWKKSGSLGNLSNTVIYPDEGVFITRISTTSPLTLTLLGSVPSTTEQSGLAGAGSSFVANRFPVDMQLSTIGFQNSPNWTSGASASVADTVYAWGGTNWVAYYYNGTNWKKSGSLGTQDTAIIPAGTAVFVTRANAASTFLSQLLPYSTQ